MKPRLDLLILFSLSLLLTGPDAAHATIVWLPIGDPGNPDDTQPQGAFGGVAYSYSISQFETTNAEYVAFLNAKAASDPLGLFDPDMETDVHGGITRSGSPGSYSYAAKAGFEDKAVNYVTFFDALRFANWVHNGEGSGDTESGAYTLLGGTETPSNSATVERNLGATVVVPTQDEWFKAAYYDGSADTYFDYPTGTDTAPTCTSPKADPNTANCGNSTIRGVTEVGAYTGSPSPYGTFDQGGNVAEWQENIFLNDRRAVRGGNWTNATSTSPLRASGVGTFSSDTATDYIGFRLALLETGPGGDPMDITSITVSKLVEREDGAIASYDFRACVGGTDIQSAEVTPPGGTPLELLDDPFGEFCFHDDFSTGTELDAAYTAGSYAFLVVGSGGEMDTKTLDLQATEPGGALDVLSPDDGDTVPVGDDLVYSWVLEEKGNGIGCIAGMSCADAIGFEVIEFVFPNLRIVVDVELPITDDSASVPSFELEIGHEFLATIGTRNGTSNPVDTTDMGDPVVTRASYEDVVRVFVEVPEPLATLLGMTSLLTLGGMARARRRRA